MYIKNVKYSFSIKLKSSAYGLLHLVTLNYSYNHLEIGYIRNDINFLQMAIMYSWNIVYAYILKLVQNIIQYIIQVIKYRENKCFPSVSVFR